MRRRTASGIVAAGTAVVMALGSGITAWATWSVGTANGAATLQGETLPVVGKPDAVLNSGGVPKVSWRSVTFRSGAAVGGYAVVRHAGSARAEVCRVAATTLSCTDAAAEAGSAVSYTVRAVAGDRWAGEPSQVSAVLSVPDGPVARTAVVKEGAGERDAKVEKAGSDGDGDGVDGAAQPTTNPDPGPTSSAPSPSVEPATTSGSPSPSGPAGGESGVAGVG
jgi:hypothetical protein